MTVAELIEALKEFPGELPVCLMEPCDAEVRYVKEAEIPEAYYSAAEKWKTGKIVRLI